MSISKPKIKLGPYKDFAKRLRAFREKLQYSQTALSNLLETEQSDIALYELGRKLPHRKTVERFAQKLGILTTDLVTDADRALYLKKRRASRKQPIREKQ